MSHVSVTAAAPDCGDNVPSQSRTMACARRCRSVFGVADKIASRQRVTGVDA